MKKLCFIVFLLVGCISSAQKNNILVESRIQLSSKDGYKIANPISVQYDHLEFLWIIGNNIEKNQFVINANDLLIQRFDGVNFFDVEFPKHTSKPLAASIIKDKKNFYISIGYQDSEKIYNVDVNTFKFTEIKDYSRLRKKYVFSFHYYLNNNLIFLFKDETNVYQYKLENEKFVLLDSLKKDNRSFILEPNFVSNKTKYTILSLGNGLLYLVNDKGKFVKKITKENFFFSSKEYDADIMYYAFNIKGVPCFFANRNNENLLKLDEKKGNLMEIPSSNFLKNKFIHWYNSTDSHFYILEKNQFDYSLQIYNINDESFNKELTISIKDYDKVIFRNLKKEIIVFYDNVLERIHFQKPKIQTYLKEKSIRAIQEVNDYKYLIGTDFKGFYEIDLKTKTEKKIQFFYKDKVQLIVAPRDIIKVGNKFIINDDKNLYFINKNYKLLEKHTYKSSLEEIIKVKNRIYRGGFYRKGIIYFDLNTNTFSKTKIAINNFVREFASNNKDLFAITKHQGLLVLENNAEAFYTPQNENPENLLSIYFNETYGLLVTTKTGRIYEFDLVEKKFELFFEDKIKTSIVGVISDNENNLWLNTYAGIVSYNPITQKTTRFSKSDGIFELEGNRYSTYKDSRGTIFIGSFKGLSIFKPKELKENKDKIELRFTSISFFDKKTKIWKTHTKPKFLDSIQEVSLPSSNQRFTAKVSALDIVDLKKYKYRYRLLNKENPEKAQWSKLYLNNEIVFSNLSAADYTLEIEALNTINETVGKPLKLTIISNQVFYKTWWFYLLLLVFIFTLFFYYFQQYNAQQKLYNLNKIAVSEAKIKEAMMLEIHHRIKNNLQVISGLLSLQAFESNDDLLTAKLNESKKRIESIAGIHNILYRTDNQEAVLLKDYFKDIINYNKTLYTRKINYKLDVISMHLHINKAVPLALIFNELINNSQKHAFGVEVKNPTIIIKFKESDKNYLFYYEDNGNIKENFKQEVSMGLKIIDMMIKQLKASSDKQNLDNFNIQISIPKTNN